MSGDTFKRALPLIAIGTLAAASGGFGLAAGPATAGGAFTGGAVLRPPPVPVFTTKDLFGTALKGLGTVNDMLGASRDEAAQRAAFDLQRAEVRLRESEANLENEARLEKALARQANRSGRAGIDPNSGSAGLFSKAAIEAANRSGGRLRTDAMLQDLGVQVRSRREGERSRRSALSRVLGLGLLSANRLNQP